MGTQNEKFLLVPSLGRTTGDFTFDGDVEVEGSVRDGVRLRASGSILVRGNIFGAGLEAGGEIAVWGAVRGESALRAGGPVSARGAEYSRIESGADIVISGDSVCCRILTPATLHVTGKLMGGRADADESILAARLGDRSGIRTELVLEPASRRAEEIRRLERGLDHVRGRLMFLRSVDVLATVRGARAALVKMAERVASADETLASEFRTALKDLVVARTRSLDLPCPRVEASLGLFPGVDLRMNGARLLVRSQLPPGTLEERAGRIHNLVDARPALGLF